MRRARALILTGKMVQDQEYTYPLYRLNEAGWEVHVATKDRQECIGFLGVRIEPTHAISEVTRGEYDLVVVPGGVKSVEHMRLDPDVAVAIANVWANGGTVASICSGPLLLVSAGLIEDRRVACYPAWRVDIENAGGEYVDAPAVVDDRVVTSPHYKHVGPWMAAALTCVQYPKGF